MIEAVRIAFQFLSLHSIASARLFSEIIVFIVF